MNLFNTLPIERVFCPVKCKFGLAFMVLVGAVITGCGAANPQTVPDNRARVQVLELDVLSKDTGQSGFAITIDLEIPTQALDFGRIIDAEGARRAALWTPTADGFAFVERAGRLYGVRDDASDFDRMTFTLDLPRARISGDYLPGYILADGPGGGGHQVIYTGHIWPYSDYGRRMPVSFSFTPRAGGLVSGFNETAPIFTDWQSPFDHPAFVLFSKNPPLYQAETSIAIVSAGDLPAWIVADATFLAERAVALLGDRFDRHLAVRPTLFLARGAETNSHETSFRFAGDALPAQIMAVLEGRPWRQRSHTGEDVLERALVHEIVHLWQSSLRPANSDVPAWIHEGAAEAIAAETLLAMGRWTHQEYAGFLAKARADCANGMRNKRLDTLTKASHFRTVYACGHMMAQLAAHQAPGHSKAPVTDFWRDYMQSTLAQNPDNAQYSFETWLDFTHKRSGNSALSEGLKAFVRTKWSLPGAQLDRLATVKPPEQAQKPIGSP